MKRLTAIGLSLAMALSLAACGGGKTAESGTQAADTAQQTAAVTAVS